jgi:Tfp pilus assembly protein PilE
MTSILIALVLSIPAFIWFYAIIDILRNEYTGSNKLIWLLISLLIPALGALLYFIIGRKQKVVPEHDGAVKSAKITAIIALIITLPISGFVGLMVHTSMNQFSEYRVKSFNAAALSDLRNAKTTVEAYYADNSKYPTSLPEPSYVSKESKAVHIVYRLKVDGQQYTITSEHENGNKTYASNSEKPQIFFKPMGAPDSAFEPM